MNYQIILTHQLRRGMAMKKLFILLAVVLLMVIMGCKSSQKAITSFNFENPAAVGVITESTHLIAITVPYGTDVIVLIPTITYTGESVSPASGVAQDFTNPVVYTVTAETGSTQDYTVTVTISSSSSSSDKAITSFNFENPAAEGVITESTHSIAVTVPYGTDVTGLIPTITYTGESVSPASGVAQDFTEPVIYIVTSEDATTQDYTVTVSVASLSAKSITAFSLAGVVGTINETGKTISVTMPSGTNVTSLVATFTTTGASVKVGSTIPISGTTAHNFTNPVVYTVTAADASTQDYTVTVTLDS
jgi:hypothetical protein